MLLPQETAYRTNCARWRSRSDRSWTYCLRETPAAAAAARSSSISSSL
ncbi:hypothetical protein SMD44_00102 [Streptomyces alboflavus]|uniref:Uncharacterized protein n=1 Tax=Streptomyces alboflavus TaxID=67267 RepID=A0A1Z1W2S6_9ACTN|nr:hypothetical protein SMD44_00102 [Streptomyces alboflavus]